MATSDGTPFDFAALVRAAVAPFPAPLGASPAVAAAWADYFQARDMANADEASDAVTDLGCEEMAAAARRLATTPCRSLADVAAKALFVIHAREETGEMTAAEGEVLASVPADALALAGDVA